MRDSLYFPQEDENDSASDKRLNLPDRFLAGLPQRGQKLLMIGVIVEDGFAAIAATHDVVNRARILDSQLARHARYRGEPPLSCQ